MTGNNILYGKSLFMNNSLGIMQHNSKCIVGNKSRKRKYNGDSSWQGRYQELDIFIVKDVVDEVTIKEENFDCKAKIRMKDKIRKLDLDLANIPFPDDLEESFYQGQMRDCSLNISSDHVVPDETNPMLRKDCNEDPIPRADMKTKLQLQKKWSIDILPCIEEDKIIMANPKPPQTPVIPKSKTKLFNEIYPNMYDTINRKTTQKLVPETPMVPKIHISGNIHRGNSGFQVPETPFLRNNIGRITIVKETPLLCSNRSNI